MFTGRQEAGKEPRSGSWAVPEGQDAGSIPPNDTSLHSSAVTTLPASWTLRNDAEECRNVETCLPTMLGQV